MPSKFISIVSLQDQHLLSLVPAFLFLLDHYLVSAKVRERLAVGKQAAQRFDRQRFNLRKLNELEVRKQYQIEITNRFAALEDGLKLNGTHQLLA